MPFKKIVKNLFEFKHIVIDNMSVDGEKLLVDVHPEKSFRNRCGCCGHKGRSTTTAPARGCGGAWARELARVKDAIALTEDDPLDGLERIGINETS